MLFFHPGAASYDLELEQDPPWQPTFIFMKIEVLHGKLQIPLRQHAVPLYTGRKGG